MALDGSFVINTSNAWVGLADEGTAKPTFTAAPAATSIAGWDFEATTALGYTMIGHTSEETAITEIEPDYEPWFSPLYEPPSGEIESALFAVQAALGAGVLAYYFGLRRGRRQGELRARAQAADR